MDIQDIRRANLNALIQERFNGTKSALAAAVDRQASYITRVLTPADGKNSKPFGEKFARHIEQALGLHPRSLDTPAPITSTTPTLTAADPVSDLLHPIDVWDDDTPLGPDEVELPFFKEVEISAGKGSAVMLETSGSKLRFGKRTLTRKGVSPEHAACAPVIGNSMEPVLPGGSTVGVDTSVTQIVDGKMYVIDHGGQLRVKVLYSLPGGGLRVRSYNSDEHPDERYDGEYVAGNIRIIGRVFWYSVLL